MRTVQPKEAGHPCSFSPASQTGLQGLLTAPVLFCRKQELLSSTDVTLPERPLSPPLTAPPTMKVSAAPQG